MSDDLPNRAERLEQGKALRERVPRESHADPIRMDHWPSSFLRRATRAESLNSCLSVTNECATCIYSSAV
jgi:hypothetical protein